VSLEADEWKYEEDQIEGDSKTSMGALGLTHKIIVGKKTMLNSSVAVSGSGLSSEQSKKDFDDQSYPNENIQNTIWNYTASTYLNHKIGARHTNRTGVTVNFLNYDLLVQNAPVFRENYVTVADEKGQSELFQTYTQSRFDLSNKVTLNAGIHFQHFTLNDNYSVEPRMGVRYGFKPGQAISLGYGLHSRLEMLFVYLGRQQTDHGFIRPNQELDFSKSHHFVVSYERAIGSNMNFRAETYYQYLFDIPVEPGTSFSMINVDQNWFINQTLTNDGTGQNYGVDLTLERFMNRGYYYLFSGSIFHSEYEGGDGLTRDSRFNKNFVFNVLAGKEWEVGRGHKNNSVGLNGKFSVNGGDRHTPVDAIATCQAREVIYDHERAFGEQKPTVFYLHFTMNYRKNKPNHASIWSFQILNALGAPEYFGYRYNYENDSVDRDKQTLVIPNISYKIVF